jgi:hypothetical protein
MKVINIQTQQKRAFSISIYLVVGEVGAGGIPADIVIARTHVELL